MITREHSCGAKGPVQIGHQDRKDFCGRVAQRSNSRRDDGTDDDDDYDEIVEHDCIAI